MSALLDALWPRLLPAVVFVEGTAIQPLPVGIGGGAYAPRSDAKTVILDFRDPAAVAEYYAAEANRFAAASVETMLAVEAAVNADGPPGWYLIQLYYAAFYAAHSLLRLLGDSCTYVNRDTGQKLLRVLDAYAVQTPFPLSSGFYTCRGLESEIVLSPLPTGGTGGSHDAFWIHFVGRIKLVSSDILRSPMASQIAQAAAGELAGLEASLCAAGKRGGWLCAIRNELQYQHGLKVWFPARLNAADQRRLKRLIDAWSDAEPSHPVRGVRTGGQLFEFASACAFLVAVCRGLVLRISADAPRRNRSFMDQGAARLLRQSGRDK